MLQMAVRELIRAQCYYHNLTISTRCGPCYRVIIDSMEFIEELKLDIAVTAAGYTLYIMR